MVLTRQQKGELERHLFYHQEERLELERRRREIMEHQPEPDESGRRAGGPTDPTGSAVVQSEMDLDHLEAWVRTAEETFERFRKTPKGSLMAAYYTERSDVGHVCRMLFISRKTFYAWREEILAIAAYRATEKGLVRI